MIKSPCVGGCVIVNGKMCARCFRTRDEIGEWSGATDERKLQVLEDVELRKREMCENKRPEENSR